MNVKMESMGVPYDWYYGMWMVDGMVGGQRADIMVVLGIVDDKWVLTQRLRRHDGDQDPLSWVKGGRPDTKTEPQSWSIGQDASMETLQNILPGVERTVNTVNSFMKGTVHFLKLEMAADDPRIVIEMAGCEWTHMKQLTPKQAKELGLDLD